MAIQPGSLITRTYADFSGVDFTDNEVSLNRSPDSVNMWKDYKKLGKCIETRPGIDIIDTFENTLYGVFFYEKNNHVYELVHSGTKLYLVDGQNKTIVKEGMNPTKSIGRIFNEKLYILDGLNFYVYDGTSVEAVEGYVPTTSIGRKPEGGGTMFEDVNMLSDYRINTFCADGESLNYYLDSQNIDNDYVPEVWIDDVKVVISSANVDYINGKITFGTAPASPSTDGQDNVKIKYKKVVSGYKNRIKHCKLMEVFDNRFFFSGNPDYPNVLFHSGLNDPTYWSDLDYYNEGNDLSPVKVLIPGNNALWVCKAPSQANTSVFYHQPTTQYKNDILINVYPSTHSSITTGCTGTGINFNDDIVFFSDRGMEGISGDINTEQFLAHRSTLVDRKLLTESGYNNMILQEWEGYLLVIIGNKIYIADSRGKVNNTNHLEYEWFYWEMEKTITSALVRNGVLYLGTNDGKLCTLTDNATNRSVESSWTTPRDNFGVDYYQKTTNKRGSVTNAEGSGILLLTKKDSNEWEQQELHENVSDYFVNRIKEKKFKTIQLGFYGMQPFKLYRTSIQAYVGNYVKR